VHNQVICFLSTYSLMSIVVTFSVLTLLVGHHEEHLACEN